MSARSRHSVSPVKPSLFKLESETTSKREYTSHKVEHKPQVKETKEIHQMKFLSRSLYSQDFFNPGQMTVENTKGAQNRVHTGFHKFNASSTYTQNYLKFDSSIREQFKPSQTRNILSAGPSDERQLTVNRTTFIRHKFIPTEPIKREDNTISLKPYPSQYKTSSSTFFETFDCPATIRRARKSNLN